MFPGSALGLLVLLLWSVPPVSGDFAMYQKFGRHARQMQNWKHAMNTNLNTLEDSAATKLSYVQGLNDSIHQAIADLDEHLVSLNTSVSQIVEAINNAPHGGSGDTVPPTPTSAFQAYISSTGTTVSDSSSISFKYTDETLDVGNDHSTSTGLFTAPKLGLYWFHCTFAADDYSKHEANMKVTRVSGGTEVIAYVKYYTSQETATMATAVLYPGDTVGMYPETNSYASYTLTGGQGNTFCGYLVAEYTDPNYTPPSTTSAPTTTADSTAAAAPSTAEFSTAAPTTTTTTTSAPLQAGDMWFVPS